MACFDNVYANDLVASHYLVDYRHILFGDVAKDGIAAVEMGLR